MSPPQGDKCPERVCSEARRSVEAYASLHFVSHEPECSPCLSGMRELESAVDQGMSLALALESLLLQRLHRSLESRHEGTLKEPIETLSDIIVLPTVKFSPSCLESHEAHDAASSHDTSVTRSNSTSSDAEPANLKKIVVGARRDEGDPECPLQGETSFSEPEDEGAREMDISVIAEPEPSGTLAHRAWVCLFWWLVKMRGQGTKPVQGKKWSYTAWVATGSFAGLLFVSGIDLLIPKPYHGGQLTLAVASQGAVATILFAAPTSHFAQPRNVIGAHIIASVTAILLDYLSNPFYAGVLPQWIAQALGPSIVVGITTRL
mmetsp:Transcript_59995/g.159471  ORF Transcript_59995/g.159471 Transcript_59995/m.159471 type:complete len:319 (-) Transcript_59995:599-1555(-)